MRVGRLAWRRVLLLAVAALAPAGLLFDGGAFAFTAGQGGTRAVTAEVVAHGTSYAGITDLLVGIECNNVLEPWNEVGIVLTNRGTSSVSYWVNETSDPDNFATHSPGSGSLAISATASITITIDKVRHPICHADTHPVTYQIETSSTGKSHGRVSSVVVNVEFTTL